MAFSENVVVGGASVNKHQRHKAKRHAVLDKRIGPRHFERFAYLNSLGGNEKWVWRDLVTVVIGNDRSRKNTINLDFHFSGRSIPTIFPSWLNSESCDVERPVCGRGESFHHIFADSCVGQCCQFVIEPVNENERPFQIDQGTFGYFGASIISVPQQNGGTEKKTVKNNQKPIGSFIFRVFWRYYAAAVTRISGGILSG